MVFMVAIIGGISASNCGIRLVELVPMSTVAQRIRH